MLKIIITWLGSGALIFAGVVQEADPLAAAREALDERQFLRAIEILAPVAAETPSPDAYLLLGLAHANVGNYDRALDLFTEAAARYPDDSRFLAETAGVHLANRDVDRAAETLRAALSVNPGDTYAADLLASIELSQGQVDRALAVWNQAERPRIDRIFQNFSPGFIDRAVPRALAFDPGNVLRSGEWKTTEARLWSSRLYSNVGLDLEPASAEDRYHAIVRTSSYRNSRQDMLFDLVRGLPVWSTHLEFYDIGHSGISWKSSYRFHSNRRRLEGRLFAPLPLPGLPLVRLNGAWRSENWSLADSIREEFLPNSEFHYQVTGLGVDVQAIPHFRTEITAGFEHRNRSVTGRIPELGMNGMNSGVFKLELAFRPLDGRLKSRIALGGFAARESLIGDLDFSGGTIELAHRFEIGERTGAAFDWSLSAGTARGDLPIDHYFNLGLGDGATHLLRAHPAAKHGRYGRTPMGTDFVLLNTSIERRLLTIPLFNTLSLPYIQVKGVGFFDAAKTFDRRRVLRQGELLKDAGGGVRFEAPAASFTILYGRDITGSRNSLYGYVERRIW